MKKRKLLHGSKKNEKFRSKMKLHISGYKPTNKMCALKNTKRKSPKIMGGKKEIPDSHGALRKQKTL